MWKQDIINKVKDIYNGKHGSKVEQCLIRDYLMFHGMTNEIRNPTYDISYQSVMDMMSGKKHNPFLWIEYMGINDNSRETIYVKYN